MIAASTMLGKSICITDKFTVWVSQTSRVKCKQPSPDGVPVTINDNSLAIPPG